MVTRPRLLIAGTHSGVGKTTVALGLMAAWRRRGLTVQPFKVGPDYLDPTHHAQAAGRASRNLDAWLLKPQQVRGVFEHAGEAADVSIIEGVMGMFDGYGSTNDRGSTAEMAKLLNVPVILVVDASHMARSIAAIVEGYRRFDPAVRLAGVIFNRVSERHARLLREAVRRYTSVPVLGYVPSDAAIAIPERHLGLVPALEKTSAQPLERLAERVAATIDLERLLRIARGAPTLSHVPGPWDRSQRIAPCVRIGLAYDRAFHFYYQENLDLLRAFGAEVVPFSPLRDAALPAELHALYLGGGFPEVFAEELAANHAMRRAVKQAVTRGVPTYAECGGLMYLTRRLVDARGRAHPMVGALPGTVRMTPRLQHFGYTTVIPRRRTILSGARDHIKGHEFHYSTWTHPIAAREAAYTVVRRGEPDRLEGMVRDNVLASYVHVHFLTNVRWAQGFVACAMKRKQA